MAATDKKKQSLYFPEDTLREIMSEAIRLDRSLSWTVQHAWRLARDEVRKFPAVDRYGEGDRDRPASPAREPREQREPPADPRRHGADSDRSHPSSQVLEFLRGKFERDLTS